MKSLIYHRYKFNTESIMLKLQLMKATIKANGLP